MMKMMFQHTKREVEWLLLLLLIIITVTYCQGWIIQSNVPSYSHQTYTIESRLKRLNVIRIRGGETIAPNSIDIIDGGSILTSEFTTTPSTTVWSFVISLLAGSIAGALGIGIAYPLDTLKTKQQVLMSSMSGTNFFPLIQAIYHTEGIGGFYGGVKVMMIGQAILKSVAFTANSMALRFLTASYPPTTYKWTPLLLAAAFAGLVTSFLTVPFERIKVMMQAQQKHSTSSGITNDKSKYYSNEIDCLRAILRNEGIQGLMIRGLGTTLAREVPSFVIYFVFYAVFMQSKIITGPYAPLVGGALAGCACWIPVYPIDVVKTIVQNTDGGGGAASSKTSTWDITKELYRTGGIGIFFDGITPKMLRAAINHAVTFFLYDMIVASATKL